MKTGLSISFRLTLWFSAFILIGFLAFGAATYLDLAATLQQGREKTLANRARRAAEFLKSAEDEPWDRLTGRYGNFTDGNPEGRLIQIYDGSGRRLLPPPGDSAADFPWPVPPSTGDLRINTSWQGRPYRVLSRNARLHGQFVRIFVAGQLDDNRMILERFTDGLWRGFPLLLAGAGLAGYFVSRRALQPVSRLIASGRSISIGNLSRRLPVSGNGDELARLAETWNAMLERLDGSVNRITRFTADASHELRSPLSFIRVASESMLRVPGLEPEAAEAFREILAETKIATRLLDDMLVLARSDGGHVEVVFHPVDLEDVASEVAGKLRALAEEKQQVLATRFAAADALISGDLPLLRRLAWILADNAIKYTPLGGRIDLAVFRSADRVLLEVADSGRGIPAESLPRIFDRFYRVDPARSGEEGTGLGLAIAKWIAEAHGAAITASSTEQVGTTFQVSFPLLRNE